MAFRTIGVPPKTKLVCDCGTEATVSCNCCGHGGEDKRIAELQTLQGLVWGCLHDGDGLYNVETKQGDAHAFAETVMEEMKFLAEGRIPMWNEKDGEHYWPDCGENPMSEKYKKLEAERDARVPVGVVEDLLAFIRRNYDGGATVITSAEEAVAKAKGE